MLRSAAVFTLVLAPLAARAAGPTVQFTLPAENTTPGVFGSLPWPNDLYFDQGQPGDGDGTLLASGASIGLGAQVITANTGSIEDALDLLDGFGTTTAAYFFLSGPLDAGSLPASPVLTPSLADSVFCADAATATPVPVAIKLGIDTRIPNVLALLPVPGKPLAPKTTYACVVRRSVTGGGQPVEPSADWLAVRDGASPNADADAIFDPVVAALGAHGVAASDIAGMTVFTTQSTTADLVSIQATVLPGLPVPAADFTSQPGLVFKGAAGLANLYGASPPAHVATVATGFYGSARFQTHDPDGDGPFGDLPLPPSFASCSPAGPCETTDERFTRDGAGHPVVIDTAQIPFTVVVPSGTPPPAGWPVVIQQHGLGGQRDLVVAFGDLDAAKGFASIGIDAAQHGYRYWNCGPSAACPQDTRNGFGGTASPDGFADDPNTGFLSVNLGFFQAFHNFLGVRDNFRQTYADLLSLVRLLHGHTIDMALDTKLDDTNIFYMGHSLGGLMGSGFVPIEPDLKAALLNATGGGLTSQLFLNSSIGAGAMGQVEGILGLDPANVFDQFSFAANFTQAIVDPADGLNSAPLLLGPAAGAPRNVIQVEDFGDQVVPNPANEALAVAASLPIFDPFVQNLHQNPLVLPIANFATPGTLHANAAAGTATAALLQNGPATHAASIGTGPGTLTFAPEFAHVEEFALTGNAFPALERGIRVPNAGILDAVLAWFGDVVASGPPGTFTFTAPENFNPVQNVEVPAGASTAHFFARTVDQGGALAASEPTPDVVVDFAMNAVATRVTAGRSILGTSLLAADADVPPGPAITVGTPGVLPFFVTLQRALAGLFSAELTIAYTEAELTAAGITPGSSAEGALIIGSFNPGTCTMGGAPCSENGDCGVNGPCSGTSYTPFVDTMIDTAGHTAHAAGITDFSTFALLPATSFAALVEGGGAARTDCLAEWLVVNPTNTPFRDKRGRVNGVQSCHDGDPSCDGDGAVDGGCTFRVGICVNEHDPALPACAAGAVGSYALGSLTPLAKSALRRANAQALLDALVAMGGTQGGVRHNVVTFSPAIAGTACTPLAALRVPTRGTAPGKAIIAGRAQTTGGTRDGDRLTLRCLGG